VSGGVYVVDPSTVYFAPIPGATRKRETRRVLVVSTVAECADTWARTVHVVVLSRQVQHFWPAHDVLVEVGDGCVDAEVIAMADTAFPMWKEDLLNGEFKGRVLLDTLNQVRAKLRKLIGA
jgi:hypothetical protein